MFFLRMVISWIINSVLQVASSSCRSDFLLISRREESLTIVAGRSTENVSFKESLVLDNSSNVKHERRKPFMQSGSLRRSLTHDESSFDSYEDIKFEKSKYRTKQNHL